MTRIAASTADATVPLDAFRRRSCSRLSEIHQDCGVAALSCTAPRIFFMDHTCSGETFLQKPLDIMHIGLIGPPFIAVPPARYGGTELFIANLARGLHARGQEVTVYANGDSRLPCRIRWRYAHADWPVHDPVRSELKNLDHTAWAVHEAAASADIIHLNDIVGVPFTRFTDQPVVLTMHHPHEPALSEQYARYPDVSYVSIGAWLARRETMPRLHVVHHGIPID